MRRNGFSIEQWVEASYGDECEEEMKESGKSRNLDEQALLRLLRTEVGTELFQN